MILESISHFTCVSTLIQIEAVRESISVKRFMQLGRIDLQTVLVTDVKIGARLLFPL